MTIDSWLIYRLTNGKEFVTDSSNASRTNLMNLKKFDYSNTLLDLFGIKESNLPKIIKSSSADFGKLDFSKSNFKEILKVLNGVPITGVLGDQHASCLGHTLMEGEVKNTYGTGCFILKNVGD